MVRKIFSLVLLLIWCGAVAHAGEVPINDEITVDLLADSFNKCAAEVDCNIKLIRDPKVVYDEENNLNISKYAPDPNSVGPDSDVFLIVPSYLNGKVSSIIIWIQLNNNYPMEKSLTSLMKYSILTLRAIAPSGDYGNVNAMFAVSDANTKGVGEYWSTVTNRKYTVTRIADKQKARIGYVVNASI